jgi:aspartate/tyrosine/aromatic aminotransferase
VRGQGLEAFLKVTAQVIFGADSPLVKDERIAVVQTLSGTGALRVAAEFIALYSPGVPVYISDPSWGNHHTIFRKAGLQVDPTPPSALRRPPCGTRHQEGEQERNPHFDAIL